MIVAINYCGFNVLPPYDQKKGGGSVSIKSGDKGEEDNRV